MKKWVLSAIVYLLVVIGAYYAYMSLTDPPADSTGHSNTEQHNQ